MTRGEELFDREVVGAIREAAEENGEGEAVAERLLAWLRATATGESDVGSLDHAEQHYHALAAVLLKDDVERSDK